MLKRPGGKNWRGKYLPVEFFVGKKISGENTYGVEMIVEKSGGEKTSHPKNIVRDIGRRFTEATRDHPATL